MRTFFLILGIVCALFSCKKKDEPVKVESPWVTANTSWNFGGTMRIVQDTLLYSVYDYIPSIYRCSFDDNLTSWSAYPTPTGFRASSLFVVYGDDVYTSADDGIYRSEDCCRTWERKNNGLPTDFELAFMSSTNAGLYACGTGAYFSSDRGDSWTDISIPGMDRITTIVAVGNTLIAYANKLSTTIVQVLYTSEDNGANWVLLNPSQGIGHFILKLTVMNDVLYAVVYNGDVDIYVSSDKGNTWIKGEGIHAYAENNISDFEFYNGIAYAATEDGVFQSSDNGKNWVRSGCYDVISLVRRNNVLYASTRTQGIWKMQL